MKFSFKNLGLVREADIEINGLTVITGLNDTGKSFLTKGIYSTVKALNECERFINTKRASNAFSALNQINFQHRQAVPFTQDRVQKFSIAPYSNQITSAIVTQIIPKEIVLTELENYKSEVLLDIEKSVQVNAVSTDKIAQRIKSINQAYSQLLSNFHDETFEEKFELYFNEEIIQKLFQDQISNLSQEAKVTNISFSEGESEVINFIISQNKTKIVLSDNAAFETQTKDATLIESPIIANLERYVTFTLAYSPAVQQQGIYLPNHYVDLSRKLNTSNVSTPLPHIEILNETKKIIGGEVVYKQDQGGINFMKNDGNAIRVNNIATGIKSFGILQMLLNTGAISENSLLIIDEPEVHLHPKWEIEYARIIVLLSQIGVKVLISSHSPYFILAIEKYSREYNTTDRTKFYFGNKEGQESIFTDETTNLNPIFEKLAEPMKRISRL